MTDSLTFERTIHFRRRRRSVAKGRESESSAPPLGRVPRLARLMALAIRFEGLIRAGVVADYAALARLGHVTRARISQIMNLLLLAPGIQEQILFLPPTRHGRDPIHLAHVQPITAVADWHQQRRLWTALLQGNAAEIRQSFEKGAQSA